VWREAGKVVVMLDGFESSVYLCLYKVR
jgi:hypothetical protein